MLGYSFIDDTERTYDLPEATIFLADIRGES
jgi:hypothetical protein